MKIIVIGSTGQLGTDLMKLLSTTHAVIGLTHRNIDVADYDRCLVLKDHAPEVIINTAAFHRTDQCEVDPLHTFAVNALGARNVALIAHAIGAINVFISTDYVFDGATQTPYTEEAVPQPLNTYGISKLAGELYTQRTPKHYIIRVASLFGVAGASGKGGNFVETMLTKAKANEPIRVVDDQTMSPTYTKDAATAIKTILETTLPFGIYHTTNLGYCTWFEFATEIFRLAGLTPPLSAISTNQLPLKAERPRFSALASTKLPHYSVEQRHWKAALHDYLLAKGHLRK